MLNYLSLITHHLSLFIALDFGFWGMYLSDKRYAYV